MEYSGYCILTWNNLEYTKACIESLECLDAHSYILVIDNGSTDGTAEYIRELDNDCIVDEYYINDKNIGLSRAWNFALNHFFNEVKLDLCFLCNNDIRFTKSFNNLPIFMREYPEYGMVCPAVLPKEVKVEDIEAEAEKRVDKTLWKNELLAPVTGITKEAYKAVGGYDENLFRTFEDCEFYHRIRKAGFGACVYYGAYIWHEGGVSTKYIPKEESEQHYKYFADKYEREGYTG